MSRTSTGPLVAPPPLRSADRPTRGADGLPRDGPAATLVIGSLALTLLYLVLVPLHLVVLTGTARSVMVPLAVLSCVVCGTVWRRARRDPGDQSQVTRRRRLLVICSVPLVNSLVHIAVTAQLEQTAVLMLSVVGVAVVHDRATHVVGLLAAACAAWVLVVVTVSPGPVAQTGHYAVQLLLACALAAGVFLIQAAVTRRLVQTQEELRRELVEVDRVREQAETDAQRFEGVFADSPVGLGLTDDQGVFVEANEALCTLFGRPRHELLGRAAADFTHPDDRAEHAGADLLGRPSSDGVLRLETRYVRPDGEVRWAWLTVRRVAGPRGESATLVHVQDVTDRRADEERLRQSRAVMRAMVDIAHASQEERDPREPVLATLTTLARATTASLLESSVPGRLTLTSSTNPGLLGTTVDLDEPSVTAYVWRTGETLFVSETQTHPMVNRRLLDLSGASSMMWQPVTSADVVIAVLALSWSDTVSEVGAFEREVVGTIAAETAIALTAESMRRQLGTISRTDPLTGLLNRRGWDEAVGDLAAQARRTGAAYTVALLDLDHFKLFNDTHGHLRGDAALVEFAAQARAALREVDLIARWGGEEFVVALRDTGRDAVGPVLERLHQAPPLGLTCSIGYCEVGPADDLGRRLAAADDALFAAKRAGRNRSLAGT